MKLTAADSKALRAALKEMSINKPVTLSSSRNVMYVGKQCGGWLSQAERKDICTAIAKTGYRVQGSVMDYDLLDVVPVIK